MTIEDAVDEEAGSSGTSKGGSALVVRWSLVRTLGGVTDVRLDGGSGMTTGAGLSSDRVEVLVDRRVLLLRLPLNWMDDLDLLLERRRRGDRYLS